MVTLTRASLLGLLLLSLTSCMHYPHSKPHVYNQNLPEYFLVILVEARQLDYSDNAALLRTIAKHPRDGSKNGDVGHAWIYLQGELNGEPVYLEGGHSGELGIVQAKYFDGVMDYFETGDPNPIRYLWMSQCDGFFQWGSGGHRPTYAVRVPLTAEQFCDILNYVETYCFAEYSLINHQCTTFVKEVAAMANLFLEDQLTLDIEPVLNFNGQQLLFWSDPQYAQLTFSSPDVLEWSLKKAVYEGLAENALNWYVVTHPVSWQDWLKEAFREIILFPKRYYRYQLMWEINNQ